MKKRILIAKALSFGVITLFILASFGSMSSVKAGTLSPTLWVNGYITDGTTGDPLVGATVTIVGVGSTTTSTSGYYSKNVPEYGTYTVQASKSGFNQNSGTVSVNYPGTQGSRNLALSHSNGAYARVKSDSTGAPIGGATMWYYMLNDWVAYWTIGYTCDANGFVYLGTYPGTYGDRFIADKNDYWGNYQEVTRNSYSVTSYTFYLKNSEKVTQTISGVYFTKGSVTGYTNTNMKFWYQTGSTITFGVTGDDMFFGFAHETTTTVSGSVEHSITPTSTNTGYLYKAYVEVSGVMHGSKPNWHEDCRYVRETEAMWDEAISTADPVGRTDQGVSTGPIQGISPGSPATIGASMRNADLSTDKFQIGTTYRGMSVGLSIYRQTANTVDASCSMTITNNNGANQYIWYYAWVQENNDAPTKGLIVHVWLDHVGPTP